MILLYLLIITALLLIILLFTVASKLIMHFDTTSSDFNVTLLWLYPFLKSVVSKENDVFVLSLYFFNKRIFRRQLLGTQGSIQNKNTLGKIKLTDLHIAAEYGFIDPYLTGLFHGAISIISKFFPVDVLYQQPSFWVNDDYIKIDATARVNLGRTILKLV